DYKEQHTTTTVDFTEDLKTIHDELAHRNVEHGVFDGKGHIRKYDSPEEILQIQARLL
ncbi:6234_t:CDS:1, partial [Funneliformis geosporum]